MAFNLAQAYAQFLFNVCIKYNKYSQYILNAFSEFNGCDEVERSVLSNVFVTLQPVDL